ncbi:hypothetical protein FSP39_016612 [Pinctada imbricata]|uniref:Protein amnionless n=1 Tax=Pinctada imbricata TaxID=66713 RepID=A0AA88YBZ5_PINIB|nr:hypothetical protein FSP39_016612 [Pinctada imbricata]
MSNNDTASTCVTSEPADFKDWLTSLTESFKSLTPGQKTDTLKALLDQCGSEQLCYLTQVYLPTVCQVDFIALLPREVAVKVLKYLDGEILEDICLVSKSWYNLIKSSADLWLHQNWKEGGVRWKGSHIESVDAHKMWRQQRQLRMQFCDEKLMKRVNFCPGDDMTYRVKCMHYRYPLIATCSEDRRVYLWDTQKDKHIKVIEAHTVCQVKFDNQFVYTASYDNTAASWDIHTGRLHCRYIGHFNGVLSIDACRERKLVITGSADSTIKLWHLDNGQLLDSFSRFHSGWIKNVRILSCETLRITENREEIDSIQLLSVLSADAKGKIVIWTVTVITDRDGDMSIQNFKKAFEFPHCINQPLVMSRNQICISRNASKSAKNDSALSFYKVETDFKINSVKVKLEREVTIPDFIQKNGMLIGVGRRFAVFHVVDDRSFNMGSFICVYDIETEDLFSTIQVPHESSKLVDRGTLGKSLGQLSKASIGLLTGIVGHDTMTSFLDDKNIESIKKNEIDSCKAQIQSRCLSFCKDIIETLLFLYRDIAFSENSDSKQKREKMKALPQEKVCNWCIQRKRERQQVSKLVTDSPIASDKITSKDVDFSFYWMQVFSKEGWSNFSCGDILCRPQEMFISNKVRLQLHANSIEDDLEVFMREVTSNEEDQFTSGMPSEDVDEVMAMFEVVGQMVVSQTRVVSFSLDVGYGENLASVCCKYFFKGQWSNTIQMTKMTDVLYTTEVQAIERVVIFSSFHERTEEISPKGSRVSLSDIDVQYPVKCVTKSTNIKHKVYPVHRLREQQYKETYPDAFDGISISESLSLLEYSPSVTFKKEVTLTFSMKVKSTDRVGLYEITKHGLKEKTTEPIVNKNSVSFRVLDPKRMVCVASDPQKMEDIEIFPRSHEDLIGVQDLIGTQDFIGAQVAVSKPSLATSTTLSSKPTSAMKSAQTPALVHKPNTGAVRDKIPMHGSKLSFKDRLKMFLGLSSHCCFILSYRKHNNSEKPVELRLDCIESLNSHIEDRLSSLKMRDYILFRPIIDPDEAILEKGSKIRLDIDGNLELVGKTDVEVTFKYLLESPMNFRVKVRSRNPKDVDSLAFMHFRKADGKQFMCCIVDTCQILGKPYLKVPSLVTDSSKIQALAIEEKNLYAVYDHLAFGTEDYAEFLKFLNIFQPKNMKRSPAQNKELLRTRFLSKRENDGATDAVYKRWVPNANFANPANWNAGRPPCGNDRVVLHEESAAVYVQTNTTIKELTLPMNGEVVFGANSILAFTDTPDHSASCSHYDGVVEFNVTYPRDWFDPRNWCQTSSETGSCQSVSVLDSERVPCSSDDVVFPRENSYFAYTTSTFQTFLNTDSGNRMFPVPPVGGRSTVTVQRRPCNDPTGCACENDQTEILNRICKIQTPHCSKAQCLTVLKPIGSCCDLCGAVMVMEYGAGFRMSNLRDGLHRNVLDKSDDYKDMNYIVSKTHTGEIQIVLSDVNGKNAAAAGQAMYKEIQNDISSGGFKYSIKKVTIETSEGGGSKGPTAGKQVSPSESMPGGEIAGIIIALIVVLVIILVAAFFIYRRKTRQNPDDLGFKVFDKISFKKPNFRKPRVEVPPSFGFRYGNAETVGPSTQGFDNPMYGNNPLEQEKPMEIEMMPTASPFEEEEQPSFDSSRGFDNPLYDISPQQESLFADPTSVPSKDTGHVEIDSTLPKTDDNQPATVTVSQIIQ